MLDYKLIEALALVVSEGGFEKAASRLMLTQSAVSQRVRQLEERTGQVLLSRATPPQPTSSGKQLLRHYLQVKLLEESLDAELKEVRIDEPVTLSIGINADSLASWFLTAVGPLLKEGQILVDLHIDDQEQTHELLKEGTVVGCISGEGTAIQGCRVEPLGMMTYRLLATPGFIETWFPDGLTPDACRKAPAVIFNRKDNLHQKYLRKVFGRMKGDFRAHFVPAPEQFMQMISQGLAYGMVPDWQGKPYLGKGSLVEINPVEQTGVNLYWHCWNLASEPLQRFSSRLVKEAEYQLG